MDISEDAFFQGDSYVEIDKSLLPHISTNASEVLTLEFSTTDANGILFWNGQKPEMPGHGQDYIALAGTFTHSEHHLFNSFIIPFLKARFCILNCSGYI